MTEEIVKLWMPLTKNKESGKIVGILSDTSLDRDDEMMSKELMYSWAKNECLPMLSDHTNKMSNWIGGWTEFKTVDKIDNYALLASPKFFSAEANPLSAQVQKQIEEALEMGLLPGISIGAIPRKSKMVEKNGKNYKVWTEAELIEASFVPVQSNRSSFAMIARSFDIDEKGVELEVTKNEKMEETNMVEEIITKTEEVVEIKKEEVVMTPEIVVEVKNEELELLKVQNAELVKKLEEANKKIDSIAVMEKAPTVETIKKEVNTDPVIKHMMKIMEGYNKK